MMKTNSRITYILLGLCLFIAAVLRFYTISAHGLAGDEKYSLFVSQFVTIEGNNQHDSVRNPASKYFTPAEFWSPKTTSDFFDSIARGDTGNGAFYTYSLHLWSLLFGVSDAALRSLSVLFNLLTLGLLFVFVKRHFHSERLALGVVFLGTISPFFIVYSQIARNYSMNMFFGLLASHLLLIILENGNKKQALNYVAYGTCVLICEMLHFSVFPLFFIHGLFVLIYLYVNNFEKKVVLVGLILAMLIPVLGVLWWLKSPGGSWLFEFVANSAKVYSRLARTNPDDYLSLTTPVSVLRQLRHVVSSMFLLIDGFPNTYIVHRVLYSIIFITFVFAVLLFCRNSIQLKDKNAQLLRLFLGMMAIIPILFLVVFALQDGNTFRILPRYVAYAYPFNLVLMALILSDLRKEKSVLNYLFYSVFSIQILLVLNTIQVIWKDLPTTPRYFSGFPSPRIPNPYQSLASTLLKMYAPGDTVIYPSVYIDKNSGSAMPAYSVYDAQLTNFYLPKKSNMIQRVDTSEPDKVFIHTKNGQKILIFDFEGAKFRY